MTQHVGPPALLLPFPIFLNGALAAPEKETQREALNQDGPRLQETLLPSGSADFSLLPAQLVREEGRDKRSWLREYSPDWGRGSCGETSERDWAWALQILHLSHELRSGSEMT